MSIDNISKKILKEICSDCMKNRRAQKNYAKEYKNIRQLIEYPKQGIMSKSIFKNNKKDISLFCMSADSEMSEHTSSRHGIVYVLEGSGVFVLKENKIKMESGVVINMDKNAKHSLYAEKNTSFLLILFD